MMRQFSFLSGIGLCPYDDALSFVGFSVIFVKSSFVLRVCGFCGEPDCFHPQLIDAHSAELLFVQMLFKYDTNTYKYFYFYKCYSNMIQIQMIQIQMLFKYDTNRKPIAKEI